MSEAQKAFEGRLFLFFEQVLSKFGYASVASPMSESKAIPHSIPHKFVYPEKGLEVSMFLTETPDGRKAVGFIMFKNEESSLRNHRTFLLDEYFTEHPSQKFRDECLPNEDFNQFIEEYFKNLEIALKTHLQDQISGVRFESHNLLGK